MLDPQVVNQYDREIFAEAVAIFIPDSISVLSKIEEAKDDNELRKWAHRIKGAFLMIGAKDCAEIAKKLEFDKVDSSGQLIEELKTAHEDLLNYLKTEYPAAG